MPAKGKGPARPDAHPIDASGVLQAIKEGDTAKFKKLLVSQVQLTFEDFNELPPGRSFSVAHQIAYHGHLEVSQLVSELEEHAFVY